MQDHSVALAAEHSLTGVTRPGKPGIVVVEGARSAVAAFDIAVRATLSTCTRNMGCWGPDNHHFQSISVVAERTVPASSSSAGSSTGAAGGGELAGAVSQHASRAFNDFVEIETETLMHLAHIFVQRGLHDLFFEATGLSREWKVPPDRGGADPYLRPRGGTRRKVSNKRIF